MKPVATYGHETNLVQIKGDGSRRYYFRYPCGVYRRCVAYKFGSQQNGALSHVPCCACTVQLVSHRLHVIFDLVVVLLHAICKLTRRWNGKPATASMGEREVASFFLHA